jgi:hypothetical protein
MNTKKMLFYMLLGFMVFLFSCSKSKPDYIIKDYKAFLYPANDLSVKVRMEITYFVLSGTKSDGFKFVGNNIVSDLECKDESGNILSSNIESLKETKISWNFSDTKENESRKVIVEFSIPHYIQKKYGLYSLKMDWIGTFKVNIENSTLEVIFPKNKKVQIVDVSPNSPHCKTNNESVICDHSALGYKDFSVDYKYNSFLILH